MRYYATLPLLKRMKVIDGELRARKWPSDSSLAADLEVEPERFDLGKKAVRS